MSVGGTQSRRPGTQMATPDSASRAEQELFEVQQRFKALMDALPVGVNFSDDVTCEHIWGNPAAQAQFEVGPQDNISASALDKRSPGRQAKFFRDGRQISASELPVQRAVAENRNIPPFELEVQLPNGRRWFAEASGAPIHDKNGNVIGGVAVTVDITERKHYAEQMLMQKVLERVSGQLIEAQEKERSQIARELHDDFCQRLAMLTLELERASEEPVATERLMRIKDRYDEITLDLQALSHELHSSKLEYLGIVAGLRSFCQEFSDQRALRIDFTHDSVPAQLPKDVSLCLFRIAQEGLHNAVKHSGTKEFSVHLHGSESCIQLEIRDAGAGFNPEDIAAHQGLGLVSMRERTNLVGGTLCIDSSPNCGTKVQVRIPLVKAKQHAAEHETSSTT